MPGNLKLEEAALKIRELARSELALRLRGVNEATTRLLIIDEVLQILGWPKGEFNPERLTSTGGYTDYLLTVDGQPRLIVEAKRIGFVQPLQRTLQGPDYSNLFLSSSCGPEMQALLEQCRMYCSDCGVSYALATTGEMWIVLIGFRSGVEWGKLRSFVFHSLDDLANRFGEFYGLVSREAIKNNSLEEKFGSMVLVKPSAALRPHDLVDAVPEVGTVIDKRIIEAFFDQFMADITRPEKRDMLEHCYVKTRELTEFSHDLQKLLEYDVILDEQDQHIEEIDEGRLTDELELQQGSGHPRTILLVGNIGAGKSTFLHRFLHSDSQPKGNICVILDLIDQAGVDAHRDRAEEQRLAKIVLEELAHAFIPRRTVVL